jgi:quercetin dioxygenase-like cupin family protein
VKVFHYTTIEAEPVKQAGAGVKVRWLITKDMGAPNFAMRLFELEAGSCSPFHDHPWEHEAFILEGNGMLIGAETKRAFKTGDVVYVPPNEKHQFRNGSKTPLKFLCLVPYTDEYLHTH